MISSLNSISSEIKICSRTGRAYVIGRAMNGAAVYIFQIANRLLTWFFVVSLFCELFCVHIFFCSVRSLSVLASRWSRRSFQPNDFYFIVYFARRANVKEFYCATLTHSSIEYAQMKNPSYFDGKTRSSYQMLMNISAQSFQSKFVCTPKPIVFSSASDSVYAWKERKRFSVSFRWRKRWQKKRGFILAILFFILFYYCG